MSGYSLSIFVFSVSMVHRGIKIQSIYYYYNSTISHVMTEVKYNLQTALNTHYL